MRIKTVIFAFDDGETAVTFSREAGGWAVSVDLGADQYQWRARRENKPSQSVANQALSVAQRIQQREKANR
jgi:hypothetical protein